MVAIPAPLRPLHRAYRNTVNSIRSEYRSRAHMDPADRLLFQKVRATPEYQRAFTDSDPLVSVIIPTYNRADLLVRAVNSLTSQTYRNLQIIVIGDGCADDTPARMAELTDSRIHFENRPRGHYEGPGDTPYFIAGHIPMVHGFGLSEGRFVCQLDDDDEYMPERIERLVGLAQRDRADLVWHRFLFEQPDGRWIEHGCEYLMQSHVTAGSIMFHEFLRRCVIDPAVTLQFGEPGDWQRVRQMKWLGAKTAFCPDILLKHYKERSQWPTSSAKA